MTHCILEQATQRLWFSAGWYTIRHMSRRNVYAMEISEYFWHFLPAAISATSSSVGCGSNIWLCRSADNCQIPDKQFIWVQRNLRHSVQAFAISMYKANWFLCGRDTHWHQSTCHQVIQVLMYGYSAWSLFAGEAVMTESIDLCSAAASVRGPDPKVQAQTKCYSQAYCLII